MIIAKEEQNTYKQQQKKGKLVYKRNNHIIIKLLNHKIAYLKHSYKNTNHTITDSLDSIIQIYALTYI